ELGTSCPDHFLRTKIKPLCVDWDPQAEDAGALKIKLEAGLAQYRRDYAQYYAKHKRADSPAMRRSSPSVILIPGIGLVAWGQSKSEARVTAEFYGAAIGVMRGAERVSHYTALDRQEAFDIEYWLLEDAKLKRLPAEQPLDRTVAVVVGAGSGIGRALVRELVGQGAAVRDQRHGPVPRRRRSLAGVAGARSGARRQPGDHDERQRGGAESGVIRLRHEQGGGEPPRARARGGIRATRAGQRRRAGDHARGVVDVPARARQ